MKINPIALILLLETTSAGFIATTTNSKKNVSYHASSSDDLNDTSPKENNNRWDWITGGEEEDTENIFFAELRPPVPSMESDNTVDYSGDNDIGIVKEQTERFSVLPPPITANKSYATNAKRVQLKQYKARSDETRRSKNIKKPALVGSSLLGNKNMRRTKNVASGTTQYAILRTSLAKGVEKKIQQNSNAEYNPSYLESRRIQTKLQEIARKYINSPPKDGIYKKNKNIGTLEGALDLLETLLSTPKTRWNEQNLMCALTHSARFTSQLTQKEVEEDSKKKLKFLSLYVEALDVFQYLLQNNRLHGRQLSNGAWAIVKIMNVFSDAEIVEKSSIILDEMMDSIVEKSSEMNVLELSMACWAFAYAYPRSRPAGWKEAGTYLNVPSYNDASRAQVNVKQFNYTVLEKTEYSNKLHIETIQPTEKVDIVFDTIAQQYLKPLHQQSNGLLINSCNWGELANVAWAFAHRGVHSESSERLMSEIAHEASERLQFLTSFSNDGIQVNNPTDINKNLKYKSQSLPWDISNIAWALGVLQIDNFRLGYSLENFVDSVEEYMGTKFGLVHGAFASWSCSDLVQFCMALAHGRIEKTSFLRSIFREINSKAIVGEFENTELTALLWVVAKLHLTKEDGYVFEVFPKTVVNCILAKYEAVPLRSGNQSLIYDIGVRSHEQANLAWSLTVLREYSQQSVELLQHIFHSAEKSEDSILAEHAHQLWQSVFVLSHECPDAVKDVSSEYRDWLKKEWNHEKSRTKVSSARHKALSQTLDFMGIAHFNEHDEDIDVAIILKNPKKSMFMDEMLPTLQDQDQNVKVAVEFDGPAHFSRNGRRPLGHTELKYRLLRHQGWNVVRVPYYEFDKIPFWASMERQRYLQRLLKTHETIRFSDVDASDYKELVDDRQSRFD